MVDLNPSKKVGRGSGGGEGGGFIIGYVPGVYQERTSQNISRYISYYHLLGVRKYEKKNNYSHQYSSISKNEM